KKEGKDILKLTLNLPLTEEEVDQVHCVGPILPNNTRPILVKVAMYGARRSAFVARKHFKLGEPATRTSMIPSSQPVYVNENLFYECQKAKKIGKVNDVWTVDGNILIWDSSNWSIPIKCQSKLDKLLLWTHCTILQCLFGIT
ncbi:hypothetical protein LSAT2_006721, partial [Lamellibrachia satsuma]